MEDKCVCKNCQHQHQEQSPHSFLKEISSLPDNTIYVCRCCGSHWMQDTKTGWDLLSVGEKERYPA